MAKKLNSYSSLTEFAPLSPDSKSEPFSIRQIFFKSKEKHDADLQKAPEQSTDRSKMNFTDESLPFESDKEGEIPQMDKNRGMSGILSKIMHNIIDKKKKGLQSYKDSDFKQYWMPDSNCKECYDCGDKFTTFRRRHHCRVCGQIFCRRCCSQEISGDLIGYTDDLRVCSYCCKTVLSCVRSLDSGSRLDEDSHSLYPNQPVGFSIDSPAGTATNSKPNPSASVRRKSSVMGFREEDIAKAKTLKPVLSGMASPSQNNNKNEGQAQDKIQLKKLLTELMVSVQSVPLWKQDYKDHHTKLFLGSDMVDWLMTHNPSLLRSDAANIGQAFLDAELIECIIPQQLKFIDGNILYKPLEATPFEPSDCKDNSLNEIQESMEPLWVKEIVPTDSYLFKETPTDVVKEPTEVHVSPTTPRFSGSLSRFSSSSSMFYLDLDVKESRVSIYKTPNPDEGSDSKETENGDNLNDSNTVLETSVPVNPNSIDRFMSDTLDDSFMKALNKDNFDNTFMKSVISSKQWHYSQLREDNGEKIAFENLNLSYKFHEEALLNQLLSAEGLSLSWSDVILPIIYHVVNCVHPDVRNDADDMDVRQYIQFKKIPGGNKSESSIVSGVVFSKTVAHKKMKQAIEKPTVLLLSSSISYQRVENKLSSLDPILMQEFEYLKNTIGKLTVFKPDILLVEKTVSRLAQEMLLALGITVVLNVKPSVMERVARGTQAAIVSTIDTHLGRPQLGTCDKFCVKSYSLNGGRSKTLMFFDGCPENLGCTILLRGGSANELKKVKQVVQFMIYAAYNWHLERSFLMDEFAFFPSSLSADIDAKVSDDELKPNVNKTETSSSAESGSGSAKKMKSKAEEVGRKLETQSISDFSDPLHSYLQEVNEVIMPESAFKVDKLPAPDTFKRLLDDIVLCCSIGIKIPLPFLETDIGKKCALRKFFPSEIYWSRHFTQTNEMKTLQEIDTQIDLDEENASLRKGLGQSKNVEMQSYHRFVSLKIVDFLKSSIEMQSMLSDFRARGGTIKYLCPHERSAREKEKKPAYDSLSSDKENFQPAVASNNTGLCWEKKIDALDPKNHQTLAVLFSSYSCTSDNAPNYCVSPWVVKMEFYGSNDITLGGFLERYCFRSSYICPSTSCVTPMTEHVRKFVHGAGCVHILLHELNTGLQAAENNILMWSWCHKCLKATPVVSMSQDTWSFSFAKYLELRFYAVDYKRRGANELCFHSLHHDHYQYFAQNQSVAIFKYTPVFIWEVAFPAFVIPVSDKAISVTSLVEKIKIIATKGHEIYSDILSILFALRKEYSGLSSEDFIDDMINMLKLEIPPFRAKIEEIQLRLTSPTLDSLSLNSANDVEQNKDVCNFMWKIEDQVVLLKYHIAEVVLVWNSRIQEFVTARKKEQKQQSKLAHQISRASEEDSLPKTEELPVEEKAPESPAVISDDIPSTSNVAVSPLKKISVITAMPLQKVSSKLYGRSLSFESVFTDFKELHPQSKLSRSKSEEKILFSAHKDLQKTYEKRLSIFSCDSSYIYGVTPGIYAGLKASDAEDDESYIICHKGNQEKKSSPVPRKHHERSKSETEAHPNENFRNSTEKYSTTDGLKPEKKNLRGLFSQFLSSSAVNPLENPFLATEHLLLPQTKIPIIVHEEEPSSIIAYTLASIEYEQKLQELKQNLSNTLSLSQKDSQASSPLLKHKLNARLSAESSAHSEGPFSSEDTFDFSADSVDKGHLKPANKASNLHLEIQFTDNTTRFYCRVYYAEQFRKLRSIIFTEGEERYIRSLSHCVQWMARGGKSGSMFCKTHDDRFILKQMPRLELQSFMDLAPSYIQYLNKAFLEQKPTLLAKIVGIYRIGFKNNANNAATKMDLLVMENLFYNRSVSKKYDLKGSIRNRLVNTNGVQEEDIVLLDENLLKITCDNPLYIRPHCKTVLTLAISNDTQFLADQSVMDYSLLVGLDEEKGELVVGIIDYIRTFTWDKKVEMLIKSSGILGGHGKLPTVVSPELYRMRFCEAMDSYFLWIPDRWTGLGKGVDG
uniref:1-phosphatidylinositol-3-phosphate 5-kinase n=1 Tax=Cupiennius salei TaxID=6928 RepID=T1E1T0_CUPSA